MVHLCQRLPSNDRIKLGQNVVKSAALLCPCVLDVFYHSSSLNLLCVVPKIWKALEVVFPAFQVVEFFGEGSIVEQLQTFSTASLIVAPHGTGLNNMTVSPLHTAVLGMLYSSYHKGNIQVYCRKEVTQQDVWNRRRLVSVGAMMPCLDPSNKKSAVVVSFFLSLFLSFFAGERRTTVARLRYLAMGPYICLAPSKYTIKQQIFSKYCWCQPAGRRNEPRVRR